jgi:putative oxidoreductase
MRAMFCLERAIFGGFFLQSGLHHFQDKQMLTHYAAAKGVSRPDAAVIASGALVLAGGLSVLAGAKPRLGLAAIVGFLVPVSLQMHRFWDVDDPQQKMTETVNFMKNMALAGAALMLMQVPEPWPASVDQLRAADEEMFVQIGGCDSLRLSA